MMTKKNKPATLTLAHINDTHSYFEPTSLQLSLNINNHSITPYVSAGGFARIATRAEQLRQDATRMKQGFLFLHAGDCFQGTLYFSLFKGKANADMLRALNIDAMALGNHELDMGNNPVAEFVRRVDFPLLAGNWDLSNELQTKPLTLKHQPNVHAYCQRTETAKWITKEVDGEPIAIFGLSLDKMTDISNPDADTPFVNAENTAKNTICAINAAGINKIILLSHLGYENDLELAKNVDGISVIVGGHSHRLQGDFSDLGLKNDDEYGLKINKTYVVQAGFHALSMGHCIIEFDKDGSVVQFEGRNELLLGRRLFLDAGMDQTATDYTHQDACEFLSNHHNVVVCKKSPNVQAILTEKYIPRVRELQKRIIAHANQPLRHVRIPDEQGPSQLAPLVSQSFAHAMTKLGHKVDFAIHNAGGVRTSLNSGAVSVADIAGKLLPFAVPIGVYHISGEMLARTLEGAINNATNNGVLGTGSGSFPYTHNLRYQYINDAPVNHRIKNLEILSPQQDWQAVDMKKTYCGTSSAYTMKGKEGFDAIVNTVKDSIVTDHSMADCFIELLTDTPNLLNQPTTTLNWHKGC